MKRFTAIPLLLSFLAATATLSSVTASAGTRSTAPQISGPITQVMICPPCMCKPLSPCGERPAGGKVDGTPELPSVAAAGAVDEKILFAD